MNKKLKEHIWHECNAENCMVCAGGLSQCIVCGQAEGTLEEYCPGSKTKKVKVRIAVAIDSDGDWGASGWGTKDVEQTISQQHSMIDVANMSIGEGEAVYWVTAELDIPEEKELKEVEGKVENDNS